MRKRDKPSGRQYRDLGDVFRGVAPDVMLALTRHFGINRESAEDALQSVFLKLVWRARARGAKALMKRFRSVTSLRSYVLRAAVNHYIDEYRRMVGARQKELVILQALEISSWPSSPWTAEVEAGSLRRAVSRLGEPYGRIFDLLLREELALSEIARKLRRKRSSIYKQYARGLRILRKLTLEEMALGRE